MRKLKLQMQVTLDGFNAAGPNDEQRWVTWDIDAIRQHVLMLLDSSDTILIGRKLAVDYIPYWQTTFQNPEDPMHDIATRIVRTRKIVFTKTLTACPWDNTELATGELVSEVNRLKAQDGSDLIVYGGSSFVAALVGAGLIDQFHLFVNPIAIGRGPSAFQELERWQPLALRQCVPYPSGLVLLEYEKA
jgi:dihydrofolate reductase